MTCATRVSGMARPRVGRDRDPFCRMTVGVRGGRYRRFEPTVRCLMRGVQGRRWPLFPTAVPSGHDAVAAQMRPGLQPRWPAAGAGLVLEGDVAELIGPLLVAGRDGAQLHVGWQIARRHATQPRCHGGEQVACDLFAAVRRKAVDAQQV